MLAVVNRLAPASPALSEAKPAAVCSLCSAAMLCLARSSTDGNWWCVSRTEMHVKDGAASFSFVQANFHIEVSVSVVLFGGGARCMPLSMHLMGLAGLAPCGEA